MKHICVVLGLNWHVQQQRHSCRHMVYLPLTWFAISTLLGAKQRSALLYKPCLFLPSDTKVRLGQSELQLGLYRRWSKLKTTSLSFTAPFQFNLSPSHHTITMATLLIDQVPSNAECFSKLKQSDGGQPQCVKEGAPAEGDDAWEVHLWVSRPPLLTAALQCNIFGGVEPTLMEDIVQGSPSLTSPGCPQKKSLLLPFTPVSHSMLTLVWVSVTRFQRFLHRFSLLQLMVNSLKSSFSQWIAQPKHPLEYLYLTFYLEVFRHTLVT